jgi:hypothetical protein
MEYVLHDLMRDSSKGHNFKIQLENEVTLEHAVGKLVALLSSYSSNPSQDFSIEEHSEYGHINLKWGELTIKDERVASGINFACNGRTHDLYRVTENNMDFDDLKKLYLFLEDL